MFGTAAGTRRGAWPAGRALTLLPLLVSLPLNARATPPSLRTLEPLLAQAARGFPEPLRRTLLPADVGPHGTPTATEAPLSVLVRVAAGLTPASVLAGLCTGRCPGQSPGLCTGRCPGPAAGQVVSLSLPADRLAQLATRPGVVQVDAGRVLHTCLDLSAPLTGAPALRQQTGLDGSGVVVGIVDTGIDFRHQDFIDETGHSRVRYLLDLSEQPVGQPPFETYGGRLYDAAALDQQLALDRQLGADAPLLVSHQDTNGHGTHVAGIAAGNGRAAGPGFAPGRYVGLAPGATLVVVRASRGPANAFDDADVLDGIHFVFDRAHQLGLPAVVNISLGTQLGPHDGTSNLARAIDALVASAPGRVVVAAAGNQGGQDLHAVGYPAAGGASQVTLEIPAYTPSAGRDLVHLELWYGDGGLAVELTSPDGVHLGPVSTGQRLQQLTSAGHVTLLNAPDGPYSGNGRHKATLIIDERDDTAPRAGRWTIRLDGATDRWDLWLVNPGIVGAGGELPRLLGPLDPDVKLNSPATARQVIAVGASTTRARWSSVAGDFMVTTARPGEHAYFSSTGPTLDGRFLPDVSAPGEFIISAASRQAVPPTPQSAFYLPGYPEALWQIDTARGVLRGTSQAAPHVTGAVALLLQRDPQLTSDQVRELLRVGARVDQQVGPGSAWSPRWGFGRLDVGLAARALGQQWGAGPADPLRSGVSVNRDLVPPGADELTLVTVIPRDAQGAPLGPGQQVELRTTAGELEPVRHVAYGRYEARFLPRGELGQVAHISAWVDGVRLAHEPQIHLTTRRRLAGQPFSASGGGCAVAGAPAALPLPLTLLLLWPLLGPRARRRRSLGGRR